MPPAPITPDPQPAITWSNMVPAAKFFSILIIGGALLLFGYLLQLLVDVGTTTPTKTPYEQLQEDTACKTPQSHTCFDSDGNWRYSFNN